MRLSALCAPYMHLTRDQNELRTMGGDADWLLCRVARSGEPLLLVFEGKALASQEEVEILGVTYDRKLTFKSHIERLAREASGKLASLRRMSWLLDGEGLQTLYKAQVRSSLEYACLAWGGAARKHLALLDKVQGRTERYIRESSSAQQHPGLCSLQHRRDVAGLTVMFKIHQQRVHHLQPLRQSLRRAQVDTRSVSRAPAELLQPRCRTWHHQRQFINTYVTWWNGLLASQPRLDNMTLESFKRRLDNFMDGDNR
ncbi:uncharacterized protein LOC135108634 [Scylla paramamosain]|uniref:uncharacterized protein LOC135108634 n=1 Tax=Scylla paramamosain TaxID=85552 RepID=UPI003082DD6D